MRAPTGTSMLIITLFTYSIIAGLAMTLQSCKRTSNEMAVAAHATIEQTRLNDIRFYEVAYGDRQGPETPYFTAVRRYMANAAKAGVKAVPSDPIMFAEMIRTKAARVFTFDDVDTLSQITVPENKKILKMLAEDPLQKDIFARWNKTTNNVFLRRTSVPKALRIPTPNPTLQEIWSPAFVEGTYLTASALTALLIYFLYNAVGERSTFVYSEYPWRTVGGVVAMLLAAPATIVIGGAMYLPRALQYDWREASKRRIAAMTRFAYQTRMLRKIPPPQIEPLPLEGHGLLAIAPAMAVPGPMAEETVETSRHERPTEAQWFGVDPDFVRGRHAAIAAAGLRPVTLGVTMPFEGQVVAIPLSDMDRFEQAAGLSADAVEYVETNIRSLYLCTFSGQAGTVRVACERQHHERVRHQLLRLSARHGGMDIVFDGTGSSVPNPESRCSGITVLHCTSLAEHRTTTETARAFGRDLGRERTLIAPVPGRGRYITDQEGIVVAQLVGRVLYTYLHGLLTAEAAWADEALMGVIEQAIDHMNDEDEATIEQVKTWRDTLDERRKEYVRLSLARFITETAEAEKAFERCTARTEEERATLTRSIRERKHLQDALARLKDPARREERERGLVAEFDRLAESEFVEGVACADGHVDVFTTSVYIAHQGKKREIGPFRIRMHEGGNIHIENVASTSKTTNWHHPHISSAGYACFGNVSESLAKYLADRQFAIVAGLVWRFLQQYNPHQGVEDIAHWKEV